MRMQADAPGVGDPLHEVVRHRRRQALAAHQHVDVLHAAGEKHGGLAGRVAAADDHHLLAGAQARLHGGGGVVDAAALEALVAGHRELAVARPGGDDDGAAADLLAVVEAQRVGRLVAVDADDAARDGEPGAELLRLDLGAAGQGLAGDSGGKAEVVLDLRAGAGLAAGRVALDHDGLQALGGRVDGRREAGWPGADDGDVEDLGVIEMLRHAEVVGQGREARVAQQAVVGADDDRQLARLQGEAFEEAAGIGVALGVEQPVRVAVAGEELGQAMGVAAVAGADDDHASLAVPDQADAAQDEGAHHDLADVGLVGDQPAELRPVHAHDPARHRGAAVHQDLAVVEEVELAGELALAMGVEHALGAVVVGLEDLDAAFEHEEEVDAALAAREHRRAGGQRLFLAVAGDARGHLHREPGEGLGLALVGIGGVGRGFVRHAPSLRKPPRRAGSILNGWGSPGLGPWTLGADWPTIRRHEETVP